jgi:hypothetical protein
MGHDVAMCELNRRLRDLAKKSRAIIQDCRLRNHEGFKALGRGKSNFCQRCLVASRVVLDEMLKELAKVDPCDHEVKC